MEEQYTTYLIRLINNDRLIGQVLHCDKDIIGIYAPMLIKTEKTEEKLDCIFSQYDELSETAIALFAHENVLTITTPKEEVLGLYNKSWKKCYPSIEEVRARMLEKAKKRFGEENVFDYEKITEMFSDLMSDSLPIDKKKLN